MDETVSKAFVWCRQCVFDHLFIDRHLTRHCTFNGAEKNTENKGMGVIMFTQCNTGVQYMFN